MQQGKDQSLHETGRDPGARDTKECLLLAAEELFAEQGVHRASLRAITQRADANLAAVHYHFGSKEELLKAVLARRLGPLNERRLELLVAAERAAPHDSPSVQEIVRAFVGPVFDMIESDSRGHAFPRFVSRALSEPDPNVRSLVLDAFRPVARRFTRALSRALPHLSDEEIHWRFFFMIGAMAQTAGFGVLIGELSGGICGPLDAETTTERLTVFLEGGLKAPGGKETDS